MSKKKLSAEHRLALSKSKQGKNNPMYGTVSPRRKIFISKGDLMDLYVTRKMFVREIAERLKCHHRTVQNWIAAYKIKLPTQKGRCTGERAARYNGGKVTITGYKYVTDRDHPSANRDGYVHEHRKVVEKFLGYHIPKEANIHHINGQKLDNRIANLAVFANASDHSKYHKHLEKHGMYALGLIKEPPSLLGFAYKVLWGGEWKKEV
jgi:hypothetical protein